MANQVFISHSSRDAAAALAVCDALEAAGVPCWIAPRDIPPGRDYNAAIMSGLTACDAMLLMFSANSADSEPVAREVERARHHKIPVLPVRIAAGAPAPALEYLISSAQWVDAFPPPLARHLDAVVVAVKKALRLAHDAPKPDPAAEPKSVGPYRLVEKLGEGGMGTVYKAEQRTPVKRTVAVKLIKPGLSTREVLARFDSERHALARMNHPNVAKVLDAGETDAGYPYFVMEYVPGVPITQFADEKKLTIRQRLELFTQACEAIAHVHAKQLLHRDVKPGNVLAYTADDGKAAVKVIDFGIAKAMTGDRLTDQTINTNRGQALGTYDSMSPEQAAGSPDIDTRTDVYSLGVLLYELLTGAKPFDAQTLHKAADDEIRRIIREVAPPRPSARLTSLGKDATAVAAARQQHLDALARQLRSELEWIPLMAMRKERERRYATPLELAADVQAYLDDRPLRAAPDSLAYRLRKTLRRNRAAVVTAAVFATVVGGSVAVYIGTINRARAALAAEQAKTVAALGDAVAQRENAAAVVKFLTEDVLAAATPEKIPDPKVRAQIFAAMVDPAAIQAAVKFGGKPAIRASVHHVIAATLLAGGQSKRAGEEAEKAVKLRTDTLGPDHRDTLSYSRQLYARIQEALGHRTEAQAVHKDTLDRRTKTLGPDDPDTLSSLHYYAWALKAAGRTAEAEPLMADAVARRTRVLGPDHADRLASMRYYGLILQALKRFDDAQRVMKETLERRERTLTAEHPATLASMTDYAGLLKELDRPEAVDLIQRAYAGRVKVLGPTHRSTLSTQMVAFYTLNQFKMFKEAEPLVIDLIKKSTDVNGPAHPQTINAMIAYAVFLNDNSRAPEAEKIAKRALDLAEANPDMGPKHPDTLQAAHNYAESLKIQQRVDEEKAVIEKYHLK